MQGKPQLILCTEENLDDYREPNLDESVDFAEVKFDSSQKRPSLPESLSQNILTQIQEFHDLMPKNAVSLKEENNHRKLTIRVYYLVKRFLTKLSASRRHKLFFKSIHFQIVGDKASGEAEKLGQKIKKHQQSFQCHNPLTGLLRVMPIIYPQSVSKIIWDLWLCIVLIYFFIMIPLELAFNHSIMYIQSIWITVPFYFFLIFDYLMKMNTVYYEYGQPIIDRQLIFQNYLKQGLIMDGVSLIVLLCGFFNDIYIQNQWLNLPLVLFISQYHYFAQVIRNVEESIHLSKTQSSIMNLGKLIFTILYFLHIYSCLWYYIGQYANQVGMVNWLESRHLSESPQETQYLEAFYFSTVTMISVGYGDIVPLNALEKICTILFMFTTCVQLSFSVNTVGEILNSISLSAENTTEKIRIINKYMNRKKISFELQYQIREYIKIYWSQQMQQENEEEERLITSLSENLRNKLIHEANFSIIEKCELFQQTFSTDTKYKLIKLFKTVLISPEQTITCELPEFNEPCLCFIDNGSLNICTNITERSESITYQQGSFFGLEELLTGQQSQLSLQSQSFVKLLVLTRTDFINTLHDNPKDYESFCKLKDETLTRQRDTNIKCKSCNCYGHDIQNCPIVHYVIDKERVIKSYQFQSEQQRVPGMRNRFRVKNQFSAVFDQWFLQEIASMIKNHDEYPIVQFYGIQLQDDVEQFKPQQSVLQSKDSLITNDRGSFCFVDQNVSPAKLFDHSIFHPQGKMIRKNYPRQSIRVKNIGAKVKFQRIIKKLMKMQNYSKAFTHKNDLELHQKFNQNIHQIVENYFKNPKIQDYLSKTEYENLYFLRMKCNLIQYSEMTLAKPFEILKEFQIYQIQNNFTQIIKQLEQDTYKQKQKSMLQSTTIPTSLNQEDRKNILKESLIRYLSYPNIYFQKYYDTKQPIESIQQIGQKKARALFKAFKKRQILRQNAFLIPQVSRNDTKGFKSSLAVGINVIVPEH